ncbi:MAG: sulfatase, partial [Nitrospirae bacterium]|nr:sulfatase [Nitrospirota bacterium]
MQTVNDSALSLQGSDKPNVILITMDTVRADHLSVYGYERDTTPNLKRLAEVSSLYSNAISTSDITLPSHASIFTGLYPTSHGAHHIFNTPSDDDIADGFANWPRTPKPLADKFNTLAEILAEKGYSTMAVVANPGYLHYYYNLNQGFNYYDYRSPVIFLGNLVGKVRPFYLRQTIHDFIAWSIPAPDRDNAYIRADGINKVVFSLMDKAKEKDDRFFMFINYMDAHAEYAPPAPYDRLFPGKDETFTLAQFRDLEHQVSKLERDITVKEQQHIVSQYDGGIAYEDFHIGQLIARLKKAGLYDNTLIIVTSDHGEAFGERKQIEHGTSVYQEQVHVPLIIKYPHSNRRTVIDKYVSGVDLMPTVLDVLGYAIPGDIQGISLLKSEEIDKNRSVISESFPDRRKLILNKRFHRIERAIFSDSMKFITS